MDKKQEKNKFRIFSQVPSCTELKGPLTDLFKPLLRKIYSLITLQFLLSSELFDVFSLFHHQ